MTWIKICGTTNLEDAQTAVEAGADALGFVFYEKSPRKVDAKTASEIVATLPGKVEKVGVFVDDSPDRVHEVAEQIGLTAVQIYYPQQLQGLVRYPLLKKIYVSSGYNLSRGTFSISEDFGKSIYALLIDSGSLANPGGTGQRFDWASAKGKIGELRSVAPIVVAGGLTPLNVGEAMRLLLPWGVDVSSGVEATPGKKDPARVRAFVAAVRSAEQVQ